MKLENKNLHKGQGQITKYPWETFRKTGLLQLANQFLHIFGWAIVLEVDDNDKVTDVYPARCGFRGFTEESNSKAYQLVTTYMKDNAEELLSEAEYDEP